MGRRTVLAAVAAAVLTAGGCGGQPARPHVTPDRAGNDPMTHERALDAIAKSHHGTRAAGTPGDAATADYIAAQLSAVGFRVRKQRFRVRVSLISGTPRVTVDGHRVDAVPLQFTGSGDVDAALWRAGGLGCADADYAGMPSGAVVVARRGHCFFRDKAARAERAGAGALLVQAAHAMSGTLVEPGIGIPVLGVGSDLPRSGRGQVSVHATVRRSMTANVIADLPAHGGSRRVVMAGAHLDSVPTGPGVNDDGSGVSGLITVGRRFAAHPPHSARIRLGFWAAEESGLVGSWRYTHGLSATARRRIRAYLNLDMIASPHPARLYYGDAAVTRVLRRHAASLRHIALGAVSDHASFQDVGIPAGGLFTGDAVAQDPCYHRACDTLSNVNAAALRTNTDAVDATLRDLAG